MQYPTIWEGLQLACDQGKLPGIDLTDITYYIGRETIIPREDIRGMWVWRETVFAFLQRTTNARPRSSACRRGRWWSSGRRSRFSLLSFRDAPPGAGPESIPTMVVMDSGLAL